MLTATEHRVVKDATRMARNAAARRRRTAFGQAEAWVAAMEARVERWPYHGELLFQVRVPGFHPATARRLEDAVAHLDATIASWCDSPAVHGPTGAKLAPLCAKRKCWRVAQDATPEAQDATPEPARG